MRMIDHREEYDELLRVSGETPAAPSNVGRMSPMNTVPAAGGLVTIADTQLISARVSAPVQWLITVAQLTKQAQSTPWASNFDGQPYNGATAIFGAPVNPAQPGVAIGMMQMRIRWGAGGVRYQTAFDYPSAGGVFGVTADTVDIDVTLRSAAAQTPINAAQVPIIGAFMVPGQAADPTPLRWLELAVQIALATGASWSVKPYARKLRVIAPGSSKATAVWSIVSGVAANLATIQQLTLSERVAGMGVNELIDVPAQAEVFGVSNLAGADSPFSLEWQLGLV